jgi:large subunit ribosomal protein L31
MKTGIHPGYYEAEVTCACGNTFTVGSTKQKIYVEICAKCHPFFTGEMRFIDTMGRVERFQLKQKVGKGTASVSKKMKKILKKKEEELTESMRPKSLKEMMDRVKASA